MIEILNPNCSEAVMRLRTSKLTKEETAKLLEKLKSFEDGKDDDWGETWSEESTVFGVPHIKVDGNAPYNNPEKIHGVLEALGIAGKVEVETDSE